MAVLANILSLGFQVARRVIFDPGCVAGGNLRVKYCIIDKTGDNLSNVYSAQGIRLYPVADIVVDAVNKQLTRR